MRSLYYVYVYPNIFLYTLKLMYVGGCTFKKIQWDPNAQLEKCRPLKVIAFLKSEAKRFTGHSITYNYFNYVTLDQRLIAKNCGAWMAFVCLYNYSNICIMYQLINRGDSNIWALHIGILIYIFRQMILSFLVLQSHSG